MLNRRCSKRPIKSPCSPSESPVIAEDTQVTRHPARLPEVRLPFTVNHSNDDLWIVTNDLESLEPAGVIRWSYLNVDVESTLIRGVSSFEGLLSSRRIDFACYTLGCNEIIFTFIVSRSSSPTRFSFSIFFVSFFESSLYGAIVSITTFFGTYITQDESK